MLNQKAFQNMHFTVLHKKSLPFFCTATIFSKIFQ